MAFSAGSSSNAETISSEINVTPLIDVLLVLLIVFMVIAPPTPRGLDSRIPQASSAKDCGLPALSVRLSGGDAGRSVGYEIDGQVVPRAEVDAALLAGLSLRSNRGVWISANAQVSYQRVAEVVSAARAAGATAVALRRLTPRG
ncbi:MAG TPA: biopolymer transporter ExbD [Acidobacteriaceae bacterium]|jgi:biopolymer transport protein ExbD|nr:biopolymer transporter ExbD [Acidobacteriaceae bacterium]